jgi:anti-sigma factor (TIGR02949 family)
MTDCGCDKAMGDLEEYLHNEVDEQDRADIAEHLDNCPDCTGEHLVGITLINKVKQACQEKAPEQLREAIRSRLENA